MIEIRSVLCPVDFSDFSKRALDHAVAIAHRYDSKVTVLHVYPPIPAFAYTAGIPPLEPVLTDADRERLAATWTRFRLVQSSSHAFSVRSTSQTAR